MKVELFYSPRCCACVDRQAELRDAAQEAIKDVEWCEINVLDSVDHAVELGVMSLPSIAIDVKLFSPRCRQSCSYAKH